MSNTVEQQETPKPNCFVRGWNWFTSRDVEWHKGYLAGTAVTVAAAIIVFAAARK